MRTIAAFALLCGAALLPACEPRAQKPAGEEAKEPSRHLSLPSHKSRPQPSLSDLGPKGRRVKVIVLPGDASVEIDGLAARRRNGVIEIAGRVGDVRRVRVFKGADQLQKDVTIEEAGVSPAVIDLAAPRPRPGGGVGPAPGAARVEEIDPMIADKFQ